MGEKNPWWASFLKAFFVGDPKNGSVFFSNSPGVSPASDGGTPVNPILAIGKNKVPGTKGLPFSELHGKNPTKFKGGCLGYKGTIPPILGLLVLL